MDAYFEGHKIFYCKSYPTIYKNGKLITIHKIIMERKLGRPLKENEVVHHIDKNRCNYSENNLICFASNADHVAFHHGCEVSYDEEGIAYCQERSIRVPDKNNRYNICPCCGGLKTFDATLCYECSLAKTPIMKVSKDLDELKTLLEKDVRECKSIDEIAIKYNVTHKTINNWLKKCGISETPAYLRMPQKEILEKEIENGSLNSVARIYGVDKSTIKSWLLKYGISYSYQVNKPVKCLTTNETFSSLTQAAKAKYPKSSVSRIKKHIKDACEQKTDYKGLYWAFE